MLILAVDTSGKQGSIALARGDAANLDLIESVPVVGGTFSAQLIPAISKLLARHAIPKEKLEGIAAASGPGSFTGLRVGLAAVKALGETLGKPIASVSVLEACAAMLRENIAGNKVLAVLDASRGDVFLGTFRPEGGRLQCLGETLMSTAEFVEYLRAQSGPYHLCSPDEIVLHALQEQGIAITEIERPGSIEIARLGAQKIAAGEVVSPDALDANYIRRAEFTRVKAPL